jgi:hypothetical protein
VTAAYPLALRQSALVMVRSASPAMLVHALERANALSMSNTTTSSSYAVTIGPSDVHLSPVSSSFLFLIFLTSA